ncbi:MAG TPA: GNAT family N-acetyltransferase [Phycisphaerales bacterium]|nr:GNAT family N-acetyltransferase [Phycisphaerales bacterium]
MTPDLLRAAAARLVGENTGDPNATAQRFLDSARDHRIDLSLMWCTLEPVTGGVPGIPVEPRIGQVCLAVIGTGRTAMIFVSGPRKGRGWSGGAKLGQKAQVAAAAEQKERVALINRACAEVGSPRPDGRTPAVLAQALLEAKEAEAARAFRLAGFAQLGDLAYMRRLMAKQPGRVLEQAGTPEWPEGLRVDSLEQLAGEGASEAQLHEWLVSALERSYVETMDCPELCGMRSIEDVLQSHRSVGVLDPSLWWLVRDRNGPQGCLLFNAAPEQDAVELVYLGLAPAVRGIGLGARLLGFGLRRLYDHVLAPQAHAGHPHLGGSGGVTCAVDTRNTPAMKLYRRAGFERFGLRLPLVRSLGPAGA